MQVTAGTGVPGRGAVPRYLGMIVINVDIAGNGRAGAPSKCTEAGNEPHQFLRCQLFDGAAAEMGMTGAGLLGRSCPQLAAGCKHTGPTHRSWQLHANTLLPCHGVGLPCCLQGDGPGKLEMVPVQ